MNGYRPKTREFHHNTADNKCQWEIYTEWDGFKDCGKKSEHDHHIIPESQQLREGLDPERSLGMPLCQSHHTRTYDETPFVENGGMHALQPVYDAYREWKPKAQHMAEITGKTIDYSTSPFAGIGKMHREKLENGERLCAGDEFTDQYYLQKMRDKATRYLAENPEEKKPMLKHHSDYDPTKKKHWYDDIEVDGSGVTIALSV